MKQYEKLADQYAEPPDSLVSIEYYLYSHLKAAYQSGFLKAREMAKFEVRDSEFEEIVNSIGEKEV